ncbi:MAG TPA: hypothetical protein VLR26_05715 [Frankiaceae bacterium]|nr:hypothetical protein [Frankiaceae bacterium]
MPAPDVDEDLAVEVDPDGGAEFLSGVEVLLQRGSDVGEPVVARSLHVGHLSPRTSGPRRSILTKLARLLGGPSQSEG